MSSAAISDPARRHRNERHWLDFVTKQHSSYIHDSARWLATEFPGSVAHCRDELRAAYSAAKKKEDSAKRRFIAGL